MAAFDYSAMAELFSNRSDAEFFARSRSLRRKPDGYRRFARSADAIRFAIEELPPNLLLQAHLKVDEKEFDGDGMRRLYDSAEYPLVRRAVNPWMRARSQ